MRYTAKFTGRQVGAIGIFHKITAEVEAESPDAATLKLYDQYEHISGLTLTPAESMDSIAEQADLTLIHTGGGCTGYGRESFDPIAKVWFQRVLVTDGEGSAPESVDEECTVSVYADADDEGTHTVCPDFRSAIALAKASV